MYQLKGCIEIKCPFSMKDQKIDDNFQKSGFLEKLNGQYQLKQNHLYYGQCQGIMKLSKVKWCDFVVYTKADCLIVRVDYNQEYIDDLYKQIHQYFFNHLLVENINPCGSIHVKLQMMDEEQFKELEQANFIIPYNDHTQRDENEQKDNDQEQLQELSQAQAQAQEYDSSQTQPISDQEDQIDATIPL